MLCDYNEEKDKKRTRKHYFKRKDIVVFKEQGNERTRNPCNEKLHKLIVKQNTSFELTQKYALLHNHFLYKSTQRYLHGYLQNTFCTSICIWVRNHAKCDVSFNAAVYEYMITTNGTRLHVCFVHMHGCFVPYSNPCAKKQSREKDRVLVLQ